MVALRRERLAGRRERRLMIRLSDEERAELDALAETAGVSVTRLLVDGALSRSVVATEPAARAAYEPMLDELRRVRREVAAVGNNLNQLAHHANTTETLPTLQLIDDGLARVRAVTVQLMRLNVRVSRQARGLPDLGEDSNLPGESEGDVGSEAWAARRVDERRGARITSWASRGASG